MQKTGFGCRILVALLALALASGRFAWSPGGFDLDLSTRAQASNNMADELSPQIDASIRRALSWLAAEQRPSGAWRADEYGESTAATSLAILAFLAGGHVPDEGPYGDKITKGIAWVLSQQLDNGLLSGRDNSHGPMYSHGITTLMLAEIAGMVNPDQVEAVNRSLERAIRLIIDAQNVPRPAQHDGGWRYQPADTDADLSVTAWQLLALRAARDIGCDVPVENIERAVAYVKRLRVPHGGGFGYMAGHGATITRSGTGIVALEVCGEHRTDETMAAANLILSRPLTQQEHYFYYGVYYCTVGMYKIGGNEWKEARAQLYSTTLDLQNPAGYWNPTDGSERRAGKVYATSLCVLALAIEYGYLPIYQR
ncbi:MAG: terpene cyclase/mutase family protein [Planctomycetaceae bacterium]|nr:terpene cyclase/mutase family protein [Planctomycetaceae bacterium]